MNIKYVAALAVGMGAILTSAPLQAQTVYPTGTTIWQEGFTYDGYTLFVAQQGFAVLIDMDGTVVNTWQSPIPGHYLSMIEPLDYGNILVYSYDSAIFPRRLYDVVELDYYGNAVWSYSLSGIPSSTAFHHENERLPNGNTLLLGIQSVLDPGISPITLRDDYILEVDVNGVPVWSWETHLHFDEFGFDDDAKALISAKGGDWAHANSISVIPPNNHWQPEFSEGNIIVSQRFTNTVFIIDKPTGQIVWRIGPDNHITFGQHNAHMIEQGLPGEGNILIFDNGSGTGYPLRTRAPGRSTVLEIDPVTKTVVWEYGDWFKFWSNIVSGAQRLPNGNTLICSGVKGRLFEVETDGTIVWEYMSPYASPPERGNISLVYRAYRVPYSWVPSSPFRRRNPGTPEGSIARDL